MPRNKFGRYKRFITHLWQQMNTNLLSLIGVIGLTLLIVLSLFTEWIVPFPDLHTGHAMMPPAWSRQGDITYILGTDHYGRDIFSRLLLGTASSVGIALLITLSITVLSILLCLCNHFFRASFVLIKVILNTVFVFPTLLIALAFALIFGNSPHNIVLAVTLSLIPQFYNGLNHAIQMEAKHEYVLAAHLDGASKWNILIHSIVPNITAQCITYISTLFTFSLLMLATLNFLELGTSAQSNDWGTLMREYSHLMDTNPAAFIFPGLSLLISVLIVHFFGASLNRALRND